MTTQYSTTSEYAIPEYNISEYNCCHEVSRFICKVCSGKLNEPCEHASRKNRCSKCCGAESIARNLFSRAKQRAQKKNLSFSITLQEVYDAVIETKAVCPVLGTRLEMGNGLKPENIASIDKLVDSKGYVPGNFLIISLLANRIKSTGTSDQIFKVAKYVREIESCKDKQ